MKLCLVSVLSRTIRRALDLWTTLATFRGDVKTPGATSPRSTKHAVRIAWPCADVQLGSAVACTSYRRGLRYKNVPAGLRKRLAPTSPGFR
eukprot:7004069-Prymnesium_polylepis.1